MDFKPNPNFEKQVKEKLRKALQQAFDRTHRRVAGQDEATVRRVLVEEAKRAGVPLDKNKVGDMVSAIARGEKFKVKL